MSMSKDPIFCYTSDSISMLLFTTAHVAPPLLLTGLEAKILMQIRKSSRRNIQGPKLLLGILHGRYQETCVLRMAWRCGFLHIQFKKPGF